MRASSYFSALVWVAEPDRRHSLCSGTAGGRDDWCYYRTSFANNLAATPTLTFVGGYFLYHACYSTITYSSTITQFRNSNSCLGCVRLAGRPLFSCAGGAVAGSWGQLQRRTNRRPLFHAISPFKTLRFNSLVQQEVDQRIPQNVF